MRISCQLALADPWEGRGCILHSSTSGDFPVLILLGLLLFKASLQLESISERSATCE